MIQSVFKPPAVPLATVDPYFSIWSMADELSQDATRHWTGKHHGMAGMAAIDGRAWRFMGMGGAAAESLAPAMAQTGLKIEPLSSIYTFEAAGIRLIVEFTTPLLLDHLEVLSRPVSFVTFQVQSIDGSPHRVQIYYDMTAEICVDHMSQEVVWEKNNLPDGCKTLRMGTRDQPILERAGDDVRIDWGYAYLVLPPDTSGQCTVGSVRIRERFVRTRKLPDTIDERMPRAAEDDLPVMAGLLEMGAVSERAVRRYLMIAYDDVLSVEYLGERLPAYWRRSGLSFDELLMRSAEEYGELMEACARVNAEVRRQAERCGGNKYADIVSLAYRQAIAAHKLVEDQDGNVLFFSKENFSNGCMGTVDVSYPSTPIFLLYAPELVKGMLRPVFRYADSGQWPYDFAPHDVGCYPKANGQAYGMNIEQQMPIEECGNMLIMTAAVCLVEENASFAEEHWEALARWTEYLLQNGLDPGNQLCTDDFAGHLAHNANLSVKAITGIAAFGLLNGLIGREDARQSYLQLAGRMAEQWEVMAREGDHYKLAFNAAGSWSLKYNLIWDKILGLDVFPDPIRSIETAFYMKNRNQFGTPLDNRKTYTKADWLVWAAALADSEDDFQALVEPLWHYLQNESKPVPFSDWYDTIEGTAAGFANRSVVGGVFIKMLAERLHPN